MAEPEYVTPSLLREWTLPEPASEKRVRGDVLVIGGARRTPGAAMLAGLAALRVGSGRLTLAVGESVATNVAVAVPESGVYALPETESGAIHGDSLDAAEEAIASAGCIVVGPGLIDPEESAALIRRFAALVPDETPVLLDAFALGPLAGEKSVQERLAGRLLLTPNVREAGFLLDEETGEDLAGEAHRIAERYDAVVSYMNVVAHPDGREWHVTTGHSGLATSGSGDVLAGAIAGVQARGASFEQAAAWGTYLHAAAGDRLAARIGSPGFIASELLAELPGLLTELR